MRKLALTCLVFMVITGCDFIQEWEEIEDAANKYTIKNYGFTSKVSFSYTNGELEQVTLIIHSRVAKDKTIAEMERIARDIVKEVFKRKSENIYVRIEVSQNDSL